jgi:transposase
MCSGLRHTTLVLSTMAASTKVSRSKVISLPRMAPNLAESQHAQIRDMILSNRPAAEIADVVGCSERSVFAIKSNLRCFSSTKAPSNGVGRPRSITPPMLDALCEYLLEKPGLYRDEMVLFVLDEFNTHVTASSIGRALKSHGWTKKTIRRIAKARNADLRDLYMHNSWDSGFRSYHYVFVDESGCDKRSGFRRMGWSPLGVTPVQIARFQREQRFQILPAYTQDGVIFARVYQGSTDSTVFEDFIEQLLPLCGKWPEPKSVLVMDNASIHHTERIEQMCRDASVKLVYLPPYSPDLNPIEEFFAELKAFIKRNWHIYKENPEQGFDSFLEWCIDVVGSKKTSARGHFRHAGLIIEEL